MKIEIPNPCHEDQKNMLPVDGGSFCKTCQKKVHDFTQKNKDEILIFFSSENREENVCGRMTKGQLLELNFDSFFQKFRLWNIYRRIAVVLYFVFGIGLFSCGSGNDHVAGEVMPEGKIRITDTTVLNENNTDSSLTRKENIPEEKQVDNTGTGKQNSPNERIADDTLVASINQEDSHKHPPPLPLVPVYKEGRQQMEKIISSNLKYPEAAGKNKIEGTVLVMFKITAEGKMKDVKVQKKLGYGCDEEAVRVVKLLKDWNPGKQGGNQIEMDYGIEVKFKMQ